MSGFSLRQGLVASILIVAVAPHTMVFGKTTAAMMRASADRKGNPLFNQALIDPKSAGSFLIRVYQSMRWLPESTSYGGICAFKLSTYLFCSALSDRVCTCLSASR